MAVKRSRRRHCGPIQAAAHKLKYANQRIRTARNRLTKLKRHLRR